MNLNDFKREYLKGVRRPPQNCIRLHCGKKHNLLVIKVCEVLVERGLPFFTECELVKYGRADVVSPLTNEIIEVSISETNKQYDDKRKRYIEDHGLQVIQVKNDNDLWLWKEGEL